MAWWTVFVGNFYPINNSSFLLTSYKIELGHTSNFKPGPGPAYPFQTGTENIFLPSHKIVYPMQVSVNGQLFI